MLLFVAPEASKLALEMLRSHPLRGPTVSTVTGMGDGKVVLEKIFGVRVAKMLSR